MAGFFKYIVDPFISIPVKLMFSPEGFLTVTIIFAILSELWLYKATGCPTITNKPVWLLTALVEKLKAENETISTNNIAISTANIIPKELEIPRTKYDTASTQ